MNFITFNETIVNTHYIKYIEKLTGVGQHINEYAIKMYLDNTVLYEWYDDKDERDLSFRNLEIILKR